LDPQTLARITLQPNASVNPIHLECFELATRVARRVSPASSGTVSVPSGKCQRHSATKPWVDRHDLPRVNFPHALNPEVGCAKINSRPPHTEKKQMRCNLCKKAKATVHITQDPMPRPRRDPSALLTLLQKHDVDDPTGFSLADLLISFRETNEN
jgi:hypothetical protein